MLLRQERLVRAQEARQLGPAREGVQEARHGRPNASGRRCARPRRAPPSRSSASSIASSRGASTSGAPPEPPRASSGSTASNRSNPLPGGSTPARRFSPNRPAHDAEGDRAGRSRRASCYPGAVGVHPAGARSGRVPSRRRRRRHLHRGPRVHAPPGGTADEYVEEPRPFRFNPSGGGAFDWDAYQREFMNPGRREDPPVADDDEVEDEPGPEPEPEEASESEYAPRGRQQRGMRPLRNLSDNVAGRGGRGLGGETIRRTPRRGPSPSRVRARAQYAPRGGFDPGASLLDWGPELPRDDFYGGGGGGGGPGSYDDYGRGGTQRMRIHSRSAGDVPRRRRSRAAVRPIAAGTIAITAVRPRCGSGRISRSRVGASRGAFAGRRSRFASLPSEAAPRRAPGRRQGVLQIRLLQPTFYEKLYDKGEARGVRGYDRSGAGGYHRSRDGYQSRRERRRAACGFVRDGLRAQSALGITDGCSAITRYFKLGSLGGDTETEEHVRARERREAIRELDREVREQNRAAAERASRGGGEKTADGKAGAAEGFRHHAGDVDPRKPGGQPSKREQMILYAKQHVPKPVQAPPRRRRQSLRGRTVTGRSRCRRSSRRTGWPHAWGGPPDVRDRTRACWGPARGRANARDAPAPGRDCTIGAREEMTELEKLEFEHRVHQQKLKELSLA